MENKIEKCSIEVLKLAPDIIKKLKNIFIYTVEDLQKRTKEDLERGAGLDEYDIMTISNALAIISTTENQERGVGLDAHDIMAKSKVLEIRITNGLSTQIEDEDSLEKSGLKRKWIRVFKSAGISRISDVMKLSGIEMESIPWIGEKGKNEIESFLQEHYGEACEQVRRNILDNPEAVSIGYLDTDIDRDIFSILREQGIYTLGELQRMTDKELADIDKFGWVSVEKIRNGFQRLGISRYKEGEERLEILNLPSHIEKRLVQYGIKTVTQLDNQTIGDVSKVLKIRQVDIENLIGRYLEWHLRNVEESKRASTQLLMLCKIRNMMEAENKKIEIQNKTLEEILEDLKSEVERV